MVPERQVKAWIDNNLNLMEFWKAVVEAGTHAQLDKTKDEALWLANYFEGRYDMAIQAREVLSKIKD